MEVGQAVYRKKSINLIDKNMKKYLIKGNYNSDGIKGLLKEGGSGRKSAIEKMIVGMGGKVESFYWALSEEVAYVIIELPDDVSALSVVLTVNSAGIGNITMTSLLSEADIDEASKKSISYTAPGKN